MSRNSFQWSAFSKIVDLNIDNHSTAKPETYD